MKFYDVVVQYHLGCGMGYGRKNSSKDLQLHIYDILMMVTDRVSEGYGNGPQNCA